MVKLGQKDHLGQDRVADGMSCQVRTERLADGLSSPFGTGQLTVNFRQVIFAN